MAAAMFMNSNSMPIAFVQSLISSVGDLKWNDEDTTGAMLSRALTYLVLYSTLGNIARWSFGVKILERADDGALANVAKDASAPKDEDKDLEIPTPTVRVDEAPRLDESQLVTHSRSPSDASTATEPHHSGSGTGARFFMPDADDEDPNRPGELSRTQTLLDINPSAADPRPVLSTKSSSATLAPQNFQPLTFAPEPSSPKSFPPSPSSPTSPTYRFLSALKRAWVGFYDFMTAPLWAALASIIIALIPPVQNIIAHHMQPVRDALEQAGDCSIPLTLVVLGAYFYTPPPQGTPRKGLKERVVGMFKRGQTEPVTMPAPETVTDPEPEKVYPGQKRTIAIAVAARMFFCPLIVIPILLGFAKADFPPVFAE